MAKVRGVALVCFTQAGCGTCRHVKTVLENMATAEPALQVFEVRADEESALAREFDVFHLPALFVYLDGEFHAPLHAEPRADALRAALADVIAAPAQEPP